MADAMRTPRWYNYWGWGSGDMLGAGAQAVITGWLFYFFVTYCDLSAGEAGMILGLPRLLEAITCPLIGYISDNLRNTWIGRKIGRRKIFLMITVPLLPSFALLFVTGQTFWYYLLVFIFFEFVYTMFLIPWETLAAEMTKDYKEKAKFAGARMIIAQASAILASFMPILTGMIAGEGSPNVFLVMASIFGLIFSFVVILVLIFSWERPHTAEELAHKGEPPSLKAALLIPVKMFEDLFSTLRLRAFRQHISIYLGGYLSQDIFNTAFAIFVPTVLAAGVILSKSDATPLIAGMMMTMYFAQLISVMIALQVIIKTGPTVAYRIAICFVTAALLLFLTFYMTSPEGFGAGLTALDGNVLNAFAQSNYGLVFWLFVPIIMAGLGRGTLNFVPWSVYNYLPDVDEAVTGQRREGIFAGVMTFTRKAAQSVALVATGALIEAGGYVATPKEAANFLPQTPEAVQMVVWVMVGGPILMMVLGALFSWNFKLNARTHAVLVHEVERLRNGETEPESEESREIVESLTGWNYKRLWGRTTWADILEDRRKYVGIPTALLGLVFVVWAAKVFYDNPLAFDLQREWALVVLVAIPFVAAAAMRLQTAQHLRRHPDTFSSPRTTLDALIDDNITTKRRALLAAAAKVVMIGALALTLDQFVNTGRIEPGTVTLLGGLIEASNIRLTLILIGGVLALGFLGNVISYFNQLIPEGDRLKQILADYRDGQPLPAYREAYVLKTPIAPEETIA